MVRVDDVARADFAFTPERTYYRFATETSIEDGDLKAIDNFDATAAKLIEVSKAKELETSLPPEMKFQVFINNRLDNSKVSEESLRRLVSKLEHLANEFAFLRGFCS